MSSNNLKKTNIKRLLLLRTTYVQIQLFDKLKYKTYFNKYRRILYYTTCKLVYLLMLLIVISV